MTVVVIVIDKMELNKRGVGDLFLFYYCMRAIVIVKISLTIITYKKDLKI